MIKIRINGVVATLTATKKRFTWTCEEAPGIAEILNERTDKRPIAFERRPEAAIASFIVDRFKARGAEIIYDSRDHEPEKDFEGMLE